jgi:hypothetical protein
MRIRPLLALGALVSLPVATGCMPQEPPVAPTVGEASPPDDRVVVSKVMVEGDRAREVPRASEADKVRPEPVFFRLGAGYGAVGRIDLSPCRDRGLDPGYVHLRVTFGGAGGVAHAVVESPTPPSPDALTCVSELLEGAQVPPFQGGDVTLSKSLFVASSAPAPEQGEEIFVKRDVKPRSGARPLTIAP